MNASVSSDLVFREDIGRFTSYVSGKRFVGAGYQVLPGDAGRARSQT
jgi:hypothetical protein